MGKQSKLLLSFIIVLAFVLRLYKIDSPVGDWHSWRQADTSAVTRNFGKFGLDLLHPRFDDLSNIPSGKDNLMGYRFVEFPIYNAISYLIFQVTLHIPLSLEVTERLVSIVASLCSIYFVFAIVRRYGDERTGLYAAVLMAALPYNIYYSRVILPEPMLVAASLGSMYFFIEWVEQKQRGWLLLSAVLGAVALTIKPVAVFFFVPLMFPLLRGGLSGKKILGGIFFGVVTVIPFVLWRRWMMQFPEGIPVWNWLFNSDGIRFKGAFFQWIFAERLAKLILGYWGVLFFSLGILKKSKGTDWFFHLWGLSMLLYVSILATGNVKHDYYQIITIPIIAIYVAFGIKYIQEQAGKSMGRMASWLLLFCVSFGMLAFSWYTIRTYYWINNGRMVEAGKAADVLLPSDAKVIAPYGGDTAYLYQINRQGWPIGFEIDDKIKKGATYYISIDPKDPEPMMLMEKYGYVLKTDQYAIIKLK